MEIKPAYVTFEQAKWLKEKGFDVPCKQRFWVGFEGDVHFQDDCLLLNWNNYDDSSTIYFSAPEQWVVVEWLKINHGIWVFPEWQCGRKNWIFNIEKLNSYDETIEIQKNYYKELGEAEYNSPQEAYSAAFDYILTNLI
jgi:hypothetical protein